MDRKPTWVQFIMTYNTENKNHKHLLYYLYSWYFSLTLFPNMFRKHLGSGNPEFLDRGHILRNCNEV